MKLLMLKDLKNFNPKITKKLFDAIDLENSINNKISSGGTGPLYVQTEVELAKEKWLK